MTEPRFEIREADWETDRDLLRQLRETVFVIEQGVPLELEWDGLDSKAIHLLAVAANGTPVGTARLLTDGHIGRMAVLADWRRQGIGSALLQRLLEISSERQLPPPFLNAQTRAVEFYRRFGFEVEGDEFMDAGIPHRRMVL